MFEIKKIVTQSNYYLNKIMPCLITTRSAVNKITRKQEQQQQQKAKTKISRQKLISKIKST